MREQCELRSNARTLPLSAHGARIIYCTFLPNLRGFHRLTEYNRVDFFPTRMLQADINGFAFFLSPRLLQTHHQDSVLHRRSVQFPLFGATRR